MDAIRLFTWNGANMGKDEDRLGGIGPDKLADLNVIDRDILSLHRNNSWKPMYL